MSFGEHAHGTGQNCKSECFFCVGEMEELPYADGTFDVVTGFNSFQYAASPVHALQEASRVTRRGGRVAMVIWGRAQDCEHAATLAAVGACLPPPPPGAAGPFALSEAGVVESLMEQAGLTPVESGEVDCPFEYPVRHRHRLAVYQPGGTNSEQHAAVMGQEGDVTLTFAIHPPPLHRWHSLLSPF